MVYYVIEHQTTESQGVAIVTTFTRRRLAEAHYHQILSYANSENSTIPKHGATMIDEDINLIKSELAHRDIDFPEFSIFYFVEFQTTGEQGATIITTFNNRGEAEERYYQTMLTALNSPVQKHGVAIIGENMTFKGDIAYRSNAA